MISVKYADVAQSGTAADSNGEYQVIETFGLRPKDPLPQGIPVQIRASA